MTARARFEAEEQRRQLFFDADYRCVVCGDPINVHGSAQLAHRVPKTKSMLTKWGADVIHSPLNLVPVCSLRCNDAVSLGTVRREATAILERIARIRHGLEPMPNMADYYAELREEFRLRRESNA